MYEKGVVQKVKNNLVYVEIQKRAECSGCRACVFGDKQSLVLPSLTETPCAEGDRVVVRMPEKSFAGASIVLFLMPLVLMLAGLLAGGMLGEVWMLIFGFVLLAAGIFIAYLCDRLIRFKPKYMPVVTDKILNTETESDTNDRFKAD